MIVSSGCIHLDTMCRYNSDTMVTEWAGYNASIQHDTILIQLTQGRLDTMMRYNMIQHDTMTIQRHASYQDTKSRHLVAQVSPTFKHSRMQANGSARGRRPASSSRVSLTCSYGPRITSFPSNSSTSNHSRHTPSLTVWTSFLMLKPSS